MTYIIIYYLIGNTVSLSFIWLFRYSSFKTAPKKSDSWASLIGVWLWPFLDANTITSPVQIIIYIFSLLKSRPEL